MQKWDEGEEGEGLQVPHATSSPLQASATVRSKFGPDMNIGATIKSNLLQSHRQESCVSDQGCRPRPAFHVVSRIAPEGRGQGLTPGRFVLVHSIMMTD